MGVTYDSYDRAYYVSDGTGSITDSFDDLNEVTQSARTYTGIAAKTLTYTRYPDGSRSAMTTPAGNFTYSYDGDGRYTSMSSPAGAYGASYYDNGWEYTRWLANGIVSSYTYNAVGALTSLSTGSTSSFSSFSYDGVFNLKGFSANYGSGSTLPNGARTFGYDSKDRLTASSIPTSSTTTVSSTFGFDSAGNRTGVNSTTIPFNSDNQCSSSGYTFDGNGNPTTYNNTSLSFDPENRVSAIGSTSSATYRADGLRAKKTTGSGTTYYLYDGGEPIIEMNSSGTVTALNVFAPDGLCARQVGSATTEYVFDQQGNVADRTDTSGTTQSVTQYDAWGAEQIISGSDTDPFGYNARSGYYLDRETGLYLCQHRFYDPANGRWLNRDPIGFRGGTNLYGYCAGGPVGGADSRGLQEMVTEGDAAWGIGELNGTQSESGFRSTIIRLAQLEALVAMLLGGSGALLDGAAAAAGAAGGAAVAEAPQLAQAEPSLVGEAEPVIVSGPPEYVVGGNMKRVNEFADFLRSLGVNAQTIPTPAGGFPSDDAAAKVYNNNWLYNAITGDCPIWNIGPDPARLGKDGRFYPMENNIIQDLLGK